MDNLKEFFGQIEERVDELWRNHPPRIELKGWWWKRHIPHYQRMRNIMQKMIDMNWESEYPNIRKDIEKMQQEDFYHKMGRF